MKALILGLWAVMVTLGATYAAAVYLPAHSNGGSEQSLVLQHEKTRVLNVPMVADGGVQGFVAMQFEFTVEAAALKTLAVPPEVYLADEAFRTVYADTTIDFRDLKKYDLTSLTRHLVDSTNARLGVPLIKDVLIVDFSYIPKVSTTSR